MMAYMKLFQYFTVLIILIVSFVFFFPRNSYAYLDPGTFSYFIQMLVAVLAGIGVAVKVSWTSIKGVFLKLFSKKKQDEKDSA